MKRDVLAMSLLLILCVHSLAALALHRHRSSQLTPIERELLTLEGNWRLVQYVTGIDSSRIEEALPYPPSFSFEVGNIFSGGQLFAWYELDPEQDPKAMDLVLLEKHNDEKRLSSPLWKFHQQLPSLKWGEQNRLLCRYEVQGDELRICFARTKERPSREELHLRPLRSDHTWVFRRDR